MNRSDNRLRKIQSLQQEILAIQGLRVPLEKERQDSGLGIINESFPNHTFPIAATHEFISDTPENAAASSGFITSLLSGLMHKGSCLWVSTKRTVFPPALAFFGIPPDQVIFVDLKSDKEALWVIEEGLKCDALSAVVGEIRELGFTESRRLQLSVEQSRVTGLLHRYEVRKVENIACVSRWRVSHAMSQVKTGQPGIGFANWNVELLKIRNGRLGKWQVQYCPDGLEVLQQEKVTVLIPTKKTG